MNIYVKYNLGDGAQCFNSFEEIPYYDTVVALNCNGNQLTTLPELPNSIKSIDCWGNQLTTLPKLPNSLKTLMCWDNQLATLPELPNSLEMFMCWNNPLTDLPKFPKSLNCLLFPANQQTVDKHNNYLQKIIYCLRQDKNTFIKNLLVEFEENCFDCGQFFINLEKYYYKKSPENKDICSINVRCPKCNEVLRNHYMWINW